MQSPATVEVAREGWEKVARLRAEADRLPRWRWIARWRRRNRADILAQAISLFWNDHANDPPALVTPATIAPRIVPPYTSIRALLDYNEADEAADYEVEGQPEGHVYEHMTRIRAWLDTVAQENRPAA